MMKTKTSRKIILILTALALFSGALFFNPVPVAHAQEEPVDDPTITPTETATPEPTATHTFTPVPVADPGYDFGVSPASDERWARPGEIVTFAVQVTNNGSADTINVALAVSEWNAWASPGSLSLASGASASVTISLAIPEDAALGDSRTVTATFTSAGDALVTSQASLTGRAVTPTATAPIGSNRPLVVISGYDDDEVKPGNNFDLDLTFANKGSTTASNVVITYEGTGIYPRDNGGVQVIGTLKAGKKSSKTQPMSAGYDLTGPAPVTVKISYTDPQGTAYAETFTISLKVHGYYGGGSYVTPTGTVSPRPQLVVTGYESNLDPLQPGLTFSLHLEIENLGSADARSVAMVVGGASDSGGDSVSGTPSPGGVGGAGSDLSNFAPLGSSNIVYLKDVHAGQKMETDLQLIVNVNTNPGAYPLKISFVYDDVKGNRLIDDQVITLLVYSLPQVEVSFYTSVEGLMVGQPGMLPLQVTNLGRKSAVLGTMRVSAKGAELTNNSTLVGVLDTGGYYTFDASIVPQKAGALPLQVSISYTDDFNQVRTITQELEVEVMDGPPVDLMGQVGPDGMPLPEMPMQEPETFWQKLLRFVKGLIGLGSDAPEPVMPEMPPVEERIPIRGLGALLKG